MGAQIPVFVSAPSVLTEEQQSSYDEVVRLLEDENLTPRALGRSDYGVDFPLKEVFAIARHCSGGVILGFAQMCAEQLHIKPGTPDNKVLLDQALPSAWNNLEAGILFGLRVPLMVFREEGIRGGVFDHGVTDVFIQDLPVGALTSQQTTTMRNAVKNWVWKVRAHYREY